MSSDQAGNGRTSNGESEKSNFEGKANLTPNREPKLPSQDQEPGVTALELELAKFIISTLALEEISAEEIKPETPLFGGGLGLDSVDALELAVALQKEYGIKLDPKDESSISALTCLKNLAILIVEHRKLAAVS